MAEDVYYKDRKGHLHKEEIYGEKWLRLAYGNPLGRLTLWLAVKRNWFSRWYGHRMGSATSAKLIQPFIQKYKINEEEFLETASAYQSFNDFFARKLKPDARPIDDNKNSIIFPADGRHLGFQDASKVKGIFVKGQTFNIKDLLNSKESQDIYLNGSIVISRLCPVDYHRFHYPLDGKVQNPRLINGSLFSVNPIALKRKISIFWENKRFVSFIENENLGKIAVLQIGATCVGSVSFKHNGQLPRHVMKGDEQGHFSFGGSSIITIFPHASVQLSEDLTRFSEEGIEMYAKMGETMATML